MNGSTNPGWLKYAPMRSICGGLADGRPQASARFSRYCRHPLYDEYAEVKNASARRTPSARICSTASARYGVQLRLPQ